MEIQKKILQRKYKRETSVCFPQGNGTRENICFPQGNGTRENVCFPQGNGTRENVCFPRGNGTREKRLFPAGKWNARKTFVFRRETERAKTFVFRRETERAENVCFPQGNGTRENVCFPLGNGTREKRLFSAGDLLILCKMSPAGPRCGKNCPAGQGIPPIDVPQGRQCGAILPRRAGVFAILARKGDFGDFQPRRAWDLINLCPVGQVWDFAILAPQGRTSPARARLVWVGSGHV